MKHTGNESSGKHFRSLALTLAALAAVVLLLAYGVLGFLLYLYFQENPGGAGQFMTLTNNHQTSERQPPPLNQPVKPEFKAYMNSTEAKERWSIESADTLNSLLWIEAGNGNGQGILLSEQGHVITPFETIQNSPYVAVAHIKNSAGESEIQGLMLLGYEEETNVALLQLKNLRDTPLHPLPLWSGEEGMPEQKLQAFMIDSETGMTLVAGYLNCPAGREEDFNELQYAAEDKLPIGSAIIDSYGRLMGLMTRNREELSTEPVCLTAEDLKTWLDDHAFWVNP